MGFPDKDRTIVRELARQVADVAHLPVQDTKRAMWTRLNRLEPVRPMVWINELPWHELNQDLQCEAADEFCRGQEYALRRTLYLWEHFRCDMVVDPVVYSPMLSATRASACRATPSAPRRHTARRTTCP